jgi:hypothetical protein
MVNQEKTQRRSKRPDTMARKKEEPLEAAERVITIQAYAESDATSPIAMDKFRTVADDEAIGGWLHEQVQRMRIYFKGERASNWRGVDTDQRSLMVLTFRDAKTGHAAEPVYLPGVFDTPEQMRDELFSKIDDQFDKEIIARIYEQMIREADQKGINILELSPKTTIWRNLCDIHPLFNSGLWSFERREKFAKTARSSILAGLKQGRYSSTKTSTARPSSSVSCDKKPLIGRLRKKVLNRLSTDTTVKTQGRGKALKRASTARVSKTKKES